MANPTEAVTKILQALTTELMGDKMETSASTAPSGPPPDPPVATDMSLDPGGLNTVADKSRQAYQKTCMWILSVFAAFGLLIFGSLPFTNISQVSEADRSRLWLGLGLAAVGLAVAVLAASAVFSPVITSLGDLDRRIARLRDKAAPKPDQTKPKLHHLERFFQPRKHALRVLKDMLVDGGETEAHLGPGVKTINELITRIGQYDEQQLRDAQLDAAEQPSQAALDKTLETHLTTLKALTQCLSDVRDADSGRPDGDLKAAAIGALRHELDAAGATARQRALNATTTARAAGDLARSNVAIKEYLGHRQQVLLEANVLFMRGTFRLARRLIMIGVLFTLIGGALYASVLPPEKEDDDTKAESASSAAWGRYIPATVTIRAGTTAAHQLPLGCTDRNLHALRSADDAVPDEKGPYTVTVTDIPCRGTVTVPKDQGTIDSPAQ